MIKNNDTNNFIDHVYSFGLHPLITIPTIITSHSKTLIDNIFTPNLSDIHSGLVINDSSDHLPIFLIYLNINIIKAQMSYIIQRE